MPNFKNLGMLFAGALAAGLDLQRRRQLHRATSVKRRGNGLPPHQGEREKARRRRQAAAGRLEFHYYE